MDLDQFGPIWISKLRMRGFF